MKTKINRKSKIIIMSIISILLFFYCMSSLSAILTYKDNASFKEINYVDVRIVPFFDETENVDVLLLGTSHMIYGVNPMELYCQKGIISYNLGGHANVMPTNYWTLINALDYTTPCLVVLDGLAVVQNAKVHDDLGLMHMIFDPFPFSLNKIRTMSDLFSDSTTGNEKYLKMMEFLCPFSVYHSRWNELKETDFNPVISPMKGSALLTSVASPNPIAPKTTDRIIEENIGIKYLRRIIELCQSRGIEILLTYLPFPASNWSYVEANSIADIAQEYQVNYINFLNMDIVDYSIDCADADSHLNPSGAYKVTDYLGNYIKTHYEVPDRREDPAYSFWLEDYKDYRSFIADVLQQQTTLPEYLMLLHDSGFDVFIWMNDPTLLQSDLYIKLFKNIGADISLQKPEKGIVINRQGGQVAQIWLEDEMGGKKFNTILGQTQMINGKVWVDGKEYLPTLIEDGIYITVLDHESHKLIDNVYFDSVVNSAIR